MTLRKERVGIMFDYGPAKAFDKLSRMLTCQALGSGSYATVLRVSEHLDESYTVPDGPGSLALLVS
jgi:hypothetical protein